MKPDEIREQFAVIGECIFRLCNNSSANYAQMPARGDADVYAFQADIKPLLLEIKAHLLQERATSQRSLTEKQAATYIGVSPRTIRNWRTRRELPVTQLGRAVRYEKLELDRFAKKRTTAIKPLRLLI